MPSIDDYESIPNVKLSETLKTKLAQLAEYENSIKTRQDELRSKIHGMKNSNWEKDISEFNSLSSKKCIYLKTIAHIKKGILTSIQEVDDYVSKELDREPK